MNKKLLTVISAAICTIGFGSQVQAASNAQITITGNVQAATCDVNVSTNQLDLGTFRSNDFTAINKPLSASIKKFNLTLSNCDAPLAANDQARILVSGQTIGGSSELFGDGSENVGIMLQKVGASETSFISNHDEIAIAVASSTPEAGDFNGKVLSLQAGLAKSSEEAAIGPVRAPLLFQFIYN